jgi:hypothetical protein
MNLGKQMTLLGLLALGYYALLLASGIVSVDVMPQFVVSAIIFLSSGRLLRRSVKTQVSRKNKKEPASEDTKNEPNWELRTQVLNWVMAAVIIGALALFVMKPVGVSFQEMLSFW